MKQLVLIHAGTTEYAKQGRIQGTLDVPLSEDGRKQIVELAGQLRGLGASSLYSAPGQASRQTSELLAAELGLKVKTLEKLTNVDQGLWQGLLVDDVKTKQPKVFRRWLEHPETVCPPEGETIPRACQRVGESLAKLVKKQKADTTIMLVAPDPLASVVRHVLTGAELGDLWHASDSAGRWEVFQLDPAPIAAETKG